MRIGVSPADQVLAQLDIALAKRLGESVDPRIELIAHADLSSYGSQVARASAASSSRRPVVWLDTETGKVVDPSGDVSSNGSVAESSTSDKAS